MRCEIVESFAEFGELLLGALKWTIAYSEFIVTCNT